MTTNAEARRAKTAQRLMIATAVALVLAFGAAWRDGQGRKVDEISGPVFPDWASVSGQAERITVTTSDETFQVVKGDEGWIIPERGDHPASDAMIRSLGTGLADLTFRGRKTADPDRFDRLGLGDPGQGGRGATLTISGPDDDTLLSAVFGDDRPGGGLYARFSDANQSYVVDGALPDLSAPSDWVDIDFLNLDNADIASVRVEPAEGAAYELVRTEPVDRDFVLTEPVEGWTLLTLGAGNAVGGALASVRFDDVRPAGELEGEPGARHIARTFDGLEVTLAVHSEPGAQWAVVSSASSADTAVLDAAALNARTDGWAYRMPVFSADRLVRSLSDIASDDSTDDAAAEVE